jgi:ABC-type glycerol-3-phosphate transport system substrate-binding protein
VPKKAVAIYLLLALFGAILFVYFTFPRTKDEIPTSNNQRPYPSSPGPNGVPVPESVPQPSVPGTPHGPTLRVMAWASPDEVPKLQAEADAFTASSGNGVSLTVDGDEAGYERDLRQALLSDTPPDVCLVASRDFSGLDPVRDLVPVAPPDGISGRSVAAFGVDGKTRAVPDEFSVDMLFYNPKFFDQAGIAYPGPHWTWDIVEAMTRALASLKLKNDSGQPIYPLELPASFDFWNILCTQAGHPALDRNVWHLGDPDGKDSQLRGLDLLHEFFHELSVTAPPVKLGEPVGRYFASQRAALLIAPSTFALSLAGFPFQMTLLPSDIGRASLAQVNGWAVTSRSQQADLAASLAQYLGSQPVHAGWMSVQLPTDPSAPNAICYQALEQSLLPRIEPKTERLAALLDQQINLFARDPAGATAETLYARIQDEYQDGYAPVAKSSSPFGPAAVKPKADVPQLRGL